jgi:DNA-binding winged helix-turn-helix (wHTH) protein/TolB-like protein/Flp pilus assembly protein TadD
MPVSAPRGIFRFRAFELDVDRYELRREGQPVKLGRQPMDLLILLVEGRRQLVSRQEIVDRLWGKDVFVDVETGVNTAISKVRQALGDSVEAPAFVETVPGRGYRFVAPVEEIARTAAAPLPASEAVEPEIVSSARVSSPRTTPHAIKAAIGLAILATAAGLIAWTWLGGAPVPRYSLAVLPFQYLGDPDRDYLAAGLTEETSASLAQVDPDRLSVKGRTLRYKGTTKTAVEIGRELAVDYLVDSAVRAEGGRLRVTATLIRVRDQEHVWSQTYDRELTSALALQQDLSTAIADQIRVRLSPGAVRGAAARQTSNAAAYDAYLRGRYLESRRTRATNLRALEEYNRAIALDPNYALAWSSLAFTYASSTLNADARPLEVAPLARNAAERSVRANPNLAEAQFALGYVNWLFDWDWPAAEGRLRLAIGLDPGNGAEHRVLGHILSQAGRHTEAAPLMRRARELEPLEALSYALSAQVAFQARQYDEAIRQARQAVLVDSAFWIGYVQLAQAYAQTGPPELALAALVDATRFSGGNSKALSLHGYVLARSGRAGEAREVLSALTTAARERYVPPTSFAMVYAGLGERDGMFEWLEQACDVRDVHLIFLPVDVKWDPYRADPRFQAVLTRCGFGHTP